MGDIKRVLVIHQGCSLVIDQREARKAKLSVQDQYGKLISEGSQALAWDPLSPCILLQPSEPGERCSGAQDAVLGDTHLVPGRLRLGQPCRGRSDPSLLPSECTFFPSLSRHHSPFHGARGADIWGSWMGFDQLLGSPCWFH